VTPRGARAGGALYPVLLLMGVLVFLGAMIPQVLVQASVSIGQDRGRDSLVTALESAVAFAEARLKKDLSDGLVLTDKPEVKPFKVKPSFSNPDFGKKKYYDWEARLLKTEVFDVIASEKDPVKTFVYAYRIQAKAWATRRNDSHEQGTEVNGLISVRILEDKGKSGVPIRTLDSVSFETMNEDRKNLVLDASGPP
jgi:hypothetical protein